MQQESMQITHGDADGVGCATLLTQALGGRVKRFYVDYNNIDAQVEFAIEHARRKAKTEPWRLFITDICPSRDVLGHLLDVASQEDGFEVLVVDHHKTTAWMDALNDDRLIHDQSACGTKLLHRWLVENISAALETAGWQRFVDLVDVYDRWILDSSLRPDSERLNRLVWFLGFERFVEVFAEDPVADKNPLFCSIDEFLVAAEKREVSSILSKQMNVDNTFLDREKRTYLFLVASSHASQLGNAALEANEDIDYAVVLNPLADKFDLRARKGGVDVSAIAKRFGGGGHAAAAGFRFPFKKFLREMFENWF